jgi:hypothetical protein
MGLRNVSGAEVLATHARVTHSGVKNRLPPPSLLPRLLVRLVLTQKARDLVGGLRLNSLHRVGVYNAAIHGEPNSAHRACTAADEHPLQTTVAQLHAAYESLTGARLELTSAQTAVVQRVCRDYRLRFDEVLKGSVFGEPFSAKGVAFGSLPDGRAAFTVRGGLGKYVRSGFVHADLRGVRARWNG